MTFTPNLSTGQCAALACTLEATALKPGNVHPQASFCDLTYADMVTSAVVVGPILQRSEQLGLGQTVYQSVLATRQAVATNTNLGILLLLSPLTMVPREQSLATGIAEVLASLTAEDSALVYAAIVAAHPGGLGRVNEADVTETAPANLIAAMRTAEDRDLIARQYCHQFRQVFELADLLAAECQTTGNLHLAIVRTFLQQMSRHPDSLIARKCGRQLAEESAQHAEVVLSGSPASDAQPSPQFLKALQQFDQWLRADGHRRNPGTSADFIAAALYACLRDGRISAPYKIENW